MRLEMRLNKPLWQTQDLGRSIISIAFSCWRWDVSTKRYKKLESHHISTRYPSSANDSLAYAFILQDGSMRLLGNSTRRSFLNQITPRYTSYWGQPTRKKACSRKRSRL